MSSGYYSQDSQNQHFPQHQQAGFYVQQNQPKWDKQDPQHARAGSQHIQAESRQQSQHQIQPELPPGWVQATDPTSGKTYYCNPQTRETKWERPTVVTNTSMMPQQQQQQQPPLPPGWVEAKDPSSGQVYFCNPQTRETRWERPVSTNSTPPNSNVQDVHSDTRLNLSKSTSTQIPSVKEVKSNNSDTQCDFDELRSLTVGQIAHLAKLQQRSKKALDEIEAEVSNNLPSNGINDKTNYVPLELSSMSSLSVAERVEPGRLDVRIYSLREELKKFGYSQCSTK